MSNTSWWDVFKANIAQSTGRYGYLFFTSRAPKVLGMFLVGYVIGRTDFYNRLVEYKKPVITIIVAGLLVGLPANYFLAKQMQDHGNDYNALKQNGFYQTIYYAMGVVPLALAYVGIFMLSFKSAIGKKLTSFLAPVGKMAFSNYIMQSLIGNFVFLAPGLYYMFKVGPVFYTLFGIGVFIFQIIFSTIWLKYFNYGPVEWLWRSATYKKWQPMKKF
jgi:uncharacterized protein